jgi:pimeloyl-ACP methyl ester carboxylesterase
VNDARDAFFANCAGDTVCATTFPNLAETYRETLARLKHRPLAVTVPPKMRQPDDRILLTASLFEAVVTNLLYYPTAYPDLPRVIEFVHDGEPQDLRQDLGQLLRSILAAQLAAAATQNRATHAAVECRDRPHYRQDLPRKDIPADEHGLDRRQLYGICARWSDPGPLPLVPAATRVPTLVLAGQFDPVARPALSRHVANLIGSSARFVEFPRVGHNVRQFSSCGAKIAADFIDHPAQELDTSCTNRAAPIPFLPKRR